MERVSKEGREEKSQGRCFLRKMEKSGDGGGSEKLVKNNLIFEKESVMSLMGPKSDENERAG